MYLKLKYVGLKNQKPEKKTKNTQRQMCAHNIFIIMITTEKKQINKISIFSRKIKIITLVRHNGDGTSNSVSVIPFIIYNHTTEWLNLL
jgi:hypothetical protein